MGHPSEDRHRKLDLWVCCLGEQSGLVMWYLSELLGRILNYRSTSQSLILTLVYLRRYFHPFPHNSQLKGIVLLIHYLWWFLSWDRAGEKWLKWWEGMWLLRRSVQSEKGTQGNTLKTPWCLDSHIKSSGTPIYIQLGSSLRGHSEEVNCSLFLQSYIRSDSALTVFESILVKDGKKSGFTSAACESGFSFTPTDFCFKHFWTHCHGRLVTPVAQLMAFLYPNPLPYSFVVPSYLDAGLGHMTYLGQYDVCKCNIGRGWKGACRFQCPLLNFCLPHDEQTNFLLDTCWRLVLSCLDICCLCCLTPLADLRRYLGYPFGEMWETDGGYLCCSRRGHPRTSSIQTKAGSQ